MFFSSYNTVNNKLFFLILIVTIVIILISGFIFFLDKPNNNSSYFDGSDIKRFKSFKNKIVLLSNESRFKNNDTFLGLLKDLNTVQNKKLSTEERYKAMEHSVGIIQIFYSDFNDPKLYDLVKEYNQIAKESFPKYYNSQKFSYPCQDSTCAETPQPEEILKIIEDIQSSDFPDQVKKTLSKDLENAGYLPNNERIIKASIYYSLAKMIEQNKDLSNKGDDKKIINKIISFLKAEYKNEYEEIIKNE